MSGATDYAFDDLPLAPVPAGTSVLVTGSGHAATGLARELVLAGDDHGEGMVFVSTDTSGRRLVADCRRRAGLDPSRLAVIDATGSGDVGTDREVHTGSVSSTGDLTGISIEYSIRYSALQRDGIERVRTCFDSVSTLLLYTEFRTVVRFVHTLAGRVGKTDGLGVFVLDPEMHDPQVAKTLERICDGHIEVRRTDGGHELRIDGLAGQSAGWQAVDL